MLITVDDVITKYEQGEYSVDRRDYKLTKLASDYVFDEDLTIKANRKLIEKHNSEVEQDLKRFREDTLSLDEKLLQELGLALSSKYELSENVGIHIARMAYDKYHGNMSVFFEEAEYLSDVVVKVLKMMEEAKENG